MIVKEYCESMNKQLAAWRANVEKLLFITKNLSVQDQQTEERQQEELQSLITDIARASDLLKYECLPA